MRRCHRVCVLLSMYVCVCQPVSKIRFVLLCVPFSHPVENLCGDSESDWFSLYNQFACDSRMLRPEARRNTGMKGNPRA